MSLGDEHGGRSDDGFGDDARIGHGGTGQTRTRLPERDDPYGSPRRTPRSSRSLVTVVAIVVLLIAAIAFANRGGGEEEGSGDSGGGSKPGAAPTAPSGEKPVAGKDGGIPSGFAQSKQGAESAATNYSVALGAEGMYKRDLRQGIVNAVYAPDIAAEREAALDKVYSDPEFLASIGLGKDGAAPKGQTFVTRFNPVGSKVQKYNNDSATVAVWYSALFGMAGEGSENPVSESWYTSTFQLTWVGGDWKVIDFKQKDGPVPVGRDQTASSAEDMADAVKEFGGFTYAR